MKIKYLSLSLLFFISTYAYQFKRITVVGSNKLTPVISSLLRGFERLGVSHDFNNWSNPGDVVYVNSEISMLERAIRLKKQGKIKRLIAGPNLVVRPIDHGGIIGAREIDRYFVNSQWTHRAYQEDMHELGGHLHIWFAGVDEQFWKPANIKRDKNVLIYWKTEPESFCSQVEAAVKKQGYNPVRLRYGNYRKEHYRKMLESAACAIFISKVESQGIALLESWAMDVPTLVWNPQNFRAYGKVYSESSSCPYLSEKTGKDWQTVGQLQQLLSNLKNIVSECHPRQWVLDHMTDTHAAQCMLDHISDLD